MKYLCDINVFIAGAVGAHTAHESAKTFFNGLKHDDSVGFCRSTQMGFLRLLTQKITDDYIPQSNRVARKALEKWLALPYVHIVSEPAGVETLWLKLSDGEKPLPKIWMDAWLAAFAICARMRLVTFDKGLNRYRKNGLDLLILK